MNLFDSPLNYSLKSNFINIFQLISLYLRQFKPVIIKYEKVSHFAFSNDTLISVSNCQSIKDKTDEIVKKENKKLSQFIGQPVSELKIVMGEANSISKSDNGSKLLIYKTKKYGIPCERKFEVNNDDMVVGFQSKGCF